MGGSGEDSFVAVVVTKLTGALLFILLLTMVIMALIPRADTPSAPAEAADAPPLAIETPATLPAAIAGRPYAVALAASGVRGPLTWTLAGDLPAGLTFDPAEGVVSGTPAQATGRPLAVEVAASDDRRTARATLVLEVLDAAAAAAPGGPAGRATLALKGWLEQGFGFLVLLLVWLLGLGVVGSLERWSGGGGRRFLAYRAAVSLAALAAGGALGLWIWGPIG
jgi:hypothetical protein